MVSTTTKVHYPNKTHGMVTTTQNYQLTARDKVLFAGCSAGARGAMFSLDYVQAMLPPGAPPVRGFLDSPMWVDVQPFSPSIMPLENETMAIYNLVNATARIPPACAAAYPGEEGWKCLYGQFRIPFVTTPYLMSASQFDKYQLPYVEGRRVRGLRVGAPAPSAPGQMAQTGPNRARTCASSAAQRHAALTRAPRARHPASACRPTRAPT